MSTRFRVCCPSGSITTPVYFTTGGITPAFDSNWDDTSIASRVPMFISAQQVPDASNTFNLCTGTQDISYSDSSSSSLKRILILQCISNPLKAQTMGVQTFTASFQGIETNAANNLFVYYTVKAVAEDGSSTTGTLLALTADDVEFSTTLRSRGFSATTTSVALNANDRLVIEVGIGGTPSSSTHSGTLRVTEDFSIADLTAASDTQTTAGCSFVNFGSTTLTLGSFSKGEVATIAGTGAEVVSATRGLSSTISTVAVGVSAFGETAGFLQTITTVAVGIVDLVVLPAYQIGYDFLYNIWLLAGRQVRRRRR